MDDQSSLFFEDSDAHHQSHHFPQMMEPEGQIPIVKAINPLEQFKDYPEKIKANLINSSFKKKYFPGIQALFGITFQEDEPNDFLESIDSSLFESSGNDNLISFTHLFQENLKEKSPHDYVFDKLNSLTEKFSEIQKRAFSSISINKTIGAAFKQHFSNFLLVKKQSEFLEDFEKALHKFYEDARKIKTPGISLIVLIYEFWMRMFRDHVRQIWKCSQKHFMHVMKNKDFSGDFIKKYGNKHSSTSSQISTEKEKRKQWDSSQLEILERLIVENTTLTNSQIQEIAENFDRTASSVSSKIRKLRKSLKNDIKMQDISMQGKIMNILSMYPSGLTKQEIVEKIPEVYEMEGDKSWKNSTGSLLSSSKSIEKVKAIYSLKKPHEYIGYKNAVSMKDKLIQCLLKLQNFRGDLKKITKQYMELFMGMQQPTEETVKTIEANISKALARYDNIFEKDKNKTVYKLSGEKFMMDMDSIFIK